MFNDEYNGMSLDDAAAKAGGYVHYYPGKTFTLEYDFAAISRYCRKNGKKKADMTEDEWKMFEFDPPLVYPRTESSTVMPPVRKNHRQNM